MGLKSAGTTLQWNGRDHLKKPMCDGTCFCISGLIFGTE